MARRRVPSSPWLPDGSPAHTVSLDEVFAVLANVCSVSGPPTASVLADHVQAAYPSWQRDAGRIRELLTSLESGNRVTSHAGSVEAGPRRHLVWQIAGGLAHPPGGRA